MLLSSFADITTPQEKLIYSVLYATPPPFSSRYYLWSEKWEDFECFQISLLLQRPVKCKVCLFLMQALSNCFISEHKSVSRHCPRNMGMGWSELSEGICSFFTSSTLDRWKLQQPHLSSCSCGNIWEALSHRKEPSSSPHIIVIPLENAVGLDRGGCVALVPPIQLGVFMSPQQKINRTLKLPHAILISLGPNIGTETFQCVLGQGCQLQDLKALESLKV